MHPFPTEHEELVHDIAYDFYGQRLATCSSDKHIKIHDYDPNTGNWTLNDSWKAHDSTISKVVWAGPEYGQIIATCSFDRTVRVFEEDPEQPINSGRRWRKMATLSDSRGPLYDLAFAPAHLGLRLGAIGGDGCFRIYDALEPNDLRNWTVTAEVQVLNTPPAKQLQSAFSLTWCPSKFSPEFIVVSALDQVFIYQRDRNGRLQSTSTLTEHNGLVRDVAWAPSMGRGYHLLATACKDGYVRIYKIVVKTNNHLNGDQSNDDRKDDEMADASMNDDADDNLGVSILNNGIQSSLPSTLDVKLLNALDEHKGEVWKVSWNSTGTILSTAGDDGKVRLWKSTYSNQFQCMSIISAEQAE